MVTNPPIRPNIELLGEAVDQMDERIVEMHEVPRPE
jgi:hypothetical protein